MYKYLCKVTATLQSVKQKEALTKCKELQENIVDLEMKLEMASENSGFIDPGRHESLVAASESDKVAASRAMKQNNQLKIQVEELENAVLQLVQNCSLKMAARLISLMYFSDECQS